MHFENMQLMILDCVGLLILCTFTQYIYYIENVFDAVNDKIEFTVVWKFAIMRFRFVCLCVCN